jgi:signal transduction histidine kinase/DNA-binding response OmpR family regulator
MRSSAAINPKEAPGRARPRPEPGTRPKARVLIVDDDERNAYAATEALEPLGQELVVARSGEEALRRLLTEDFAVILLDLHMPGMDGYETAQLIRQRRRTRDIPIVFLTAVFRDEAHLFKAYSAGAVDVVFKPVDPFTLRSKVSVLVDLHLKTEEVKQQAERSRHLLEENARVTTEKLNAERALRKSQERQHAILRSLPIVFTSRAPLAPFPALFVSDSVKTLTGFPPEAFLDEPTFGLSRIHPDDLQTVVNALSSAADSGAYACEYRWQCADGVYRSFLDQGVLAPSADGEAREIIGALLDSTERRSLEEQLAQARKMEAVGQLTGGVAHDFNNLLTVIQGNVDFVLPRLTDDKSRRQLAAARHAAERGQTLTRQLLAFSRRQHLKPESFDLNELIASFKPLLQQAVGEGVTILLRLSDEPVCVNVDPAQLETALLNLAVNARDAMRHGGELTIATERGPASAAPQPDRGLPVQAWARLAISDTGEGMDSATADRIFEPFFTTKEVGKGSGLGLSQVYGFVRQSGGHVSVKSEPGAGARFELFLPAVAEAARKRPAPPPSAEAPGGSERLLVVEDDAAVLGLTVEMLEQLGYRVAIARNAEEALTRLKSRARFDLLVSDVVMPGGVNGIELARRAAELRPGLKVLLTSGYVGDKAVIGQTDFPLLDKPYRRERLAGRIREILDDDGPGPAKAQPEHKAGAAA